jgi:hypothetical protein
MGTAARAGLSLFIRYSTVPLLKIGSTGVKQLDQQRDPTGEEVVTATGRTLSHC